jgi:hypothetical protein
MPYAVFDFPGLRAHLARASPLEGDLEVEAIIDPRASRPSDRPLRTLRLQVERYEVIGSSIFLEGRVSNPETTSVASPTVLADVWSTDGNLLTAGWFSRAESLPAGESMAFALRLSVPLDADPAMSEYDLQALGLAP